MSPTTAMTTPITARTFLAGGEGDPDSVDSVARAVSDSKGARLAIRALGPLPASARESVDREIGTVTSGLLGIDLGDCLTAGWLKHRALRDEARRTLAAPGSEAVVPLLSHRITSTYRPRVDLVVDDVVLNSFDFVLTLVFDLVGVSAVVAGGHLVAVRGGECLVTATLRLEGAPLAERQATMDLALLVPLRAPFPLVRPTVVPPQGAGYDASVTG